MNKKEIIAELLLKAKRTLGAKDLSEEYITFVVNKCEKFGVEGVRIALEKWVEKNKFMPKPAEVISECKFWEDKDKKRMSLSPSETRCKYFSADEHPVSKSMCQKKDIPDDDVHMSNLQYGMTLCRWHSECQHAKIFPNSSIARFVKIHLKNMIKFHFRGGSDASDEHKGLNFDVLAKINTSVAGEVANRR
jgi:hypothetical protein